MEQSVTLAGFYMKQRLATQTKAFSHFLWSCAGMLLVADYPRFSQRRVKKPYKRFFRHLATHVSTKAL